jgi:uncharacterized protein YdiU (UPF0061 family)
MQEEVLNFPQKLSSISAQEIDRRNKIQERITKTLNELKKYEKAMFHQTMRRRVGLVKFDTEEKPLS